MEDKFMDLWKTNGSKLGYLRKKRREVDGQIVTAGISSGAGFYRGCYRLDLETSGVD